MFLEKIHGVVLCIIFGRGSLLIGKILLVSLLLINSTISFIEENNAGNAAAALMARLAPKAKVPNLIHS